MAMNELTTVVSSDRRSTIVNLKQVSEMPLRNALQSFDKNGDGKIDVSELQKIVYWYGLWKYASIGLCMVIMLLIWSTFGLTIWAINLTKDYTVKGGVLTGGDEVVKMSVASSYIPLIWATLLDRRHLDSLESLTIDVTQSSGKFSAGVYHVKVASYLHANSTYLKLFGTDGSRVWINTGTVVLHHPDANEAIMVCGAAACNTLAVDVKPDYLQQLAQRSTALYESNGDFELPATVDGVVINKADGEDKTCMPNATLEPFTSVDIGNANDRGGWAAGGGAVQVNGQPGTQNNGAQEEQIKYSWFQGPKKLHENLEDAHLLKLKDDSIKDLPTQRGPQLAKQDSKRAVSGDGQKKIVGNFDNFSRSDPKAPHPIMKAQGNADTAYASLGGLREGTIMVGNVQFDLNEAARQQMEELHASSKAAAKTLKDVENDIKSKGMLK